MTIQKLLLTILVLMLGINYSHGQKIGSFDYPKGLYKTKEDFINKIPSEIRDLSIKEIELVNDTDSIIQRCYISDAKTNKRIKKVFAISYDGNLYFSNWAILKNKNEEDKSLSPASSMNAFVLVTIWGKKYLYTEAGLVNHWQSGLSGGVAGGVGGLVGGALGAAVDGAFPETTAFGTGLVWDIEAKEFNIFRNCPDFNDFIAGFGIEQIECGNEPFELNRIREIIQTINE